MMWLLIVAHVATGPVNIKHAGKYESLSRCTEAGRQWEKIFMAQGRQATAVCLEVNQ